jgi:hypothetical protein
MADQDPPVLFLDIDEVLWFQRVKLAMPGSDGIDPVSAAMIVRICVATGARIVVTSTWRCSPVRCKAMFDVHGLTPHLWSPIVLPADDPDDAYDLRDHPDHDDVRDAWRVESQQRSRDQAIRNWLALHPLVKRWIVVDDSRNDFAQDILDRLVQTDPVFGIGIDEHFRAMRLLDGRSLDATDDLRRVSSRHTIANMAAQAIAAISFLAR